MKLCIECPRKASFAISLFMVPSSGITCHTICGQPTCHWPPSERDLKHFCLTLTRSSAFAASFENLGYISDIIIIIIITFIHANADFLTHPVASWRCSADDDVEELRTISSDKYCSDDAGSSTDNKVLLMWPDETDSLPDILLGLNKAQLLYEWFSG